MSVNQSDLDVLLLASNFGNMVNMVRDSFQRRVSRNEVRRKVDHDNRVGLVRTGANHLEDVIGHVASNVVNCTRRRVGPDDGCLADLECLTCGVIRGVAEVNQHADAVHFLDKGHTKWAA